jgi:hypothetical protein
MMTIPADFSPRCRQFLTDLAALCLRHQVHITPSGYDMLQIWDLHPEHVEGFEIEGIDDCTQQEAS